MHKIKYIYALINHYKSKSQIRNKTQNTPIRINNLIKNKIIHIEHEYNHLSYYEATS